jgi:hypothetical protein
MYLHFQKIKEETKDEKTRKNGDKRSQKIKNHSKKICLIYLLGNRCRMEKTTETKKKKRMHLDV